MSSDEQSPSYVRTVTRYRDHSIRLNPLETAAGAKTDAFHIGEPAPHPDGDVWLYEYPRDMVKDYPSEAEAREAALRIAKAWIDSHLG